MKKTLALIISVLLLCTAITPSVLAAEEPIVSTDTKVNTESQVGADDGIDISTPSDPITITAGEETTVTDANITAPDENDGSAIPVSISVLETTPVHIATSAAITLTYFDEPERTDAVAFAVGTTQEELTKWFVDTVAGFTGYDEEGNPYDLVSGEWSLDAVDTVTPGVYYASVVPDLGTEYTLEDGVTLPRQLCAVSIQIPGEPDINCCVAGRGFLHFPWVLSIEQQEQLDDFAVWLREDGGEWTCLSDGFLIISDGLQLSQRVLTYGSTYQLKVTYPGGQTGVLTFQYDGELSILDYSEGDRDGGDAGGSGSGAGTQPAPTLPQAPNDSSDDSNQSGGNSTPVPDDSSPETNDISQDSGSSPEEQQKTEEPQMPIEPQMPVEPQRPEEPRKPEKPQMSEEPQIPQEGQDSSSDETQRTPNAPQAPNSSQNNENHSIDNNSQVQIPVSEIASTVQGNYSKTQPKDSANAVMNSVPDDDNTRSDKTSESQVPASVTESFSPTQTIISGLRLKDLCKDEESVVFGSGDITVSIPSDLLLALNLTDSDTLSVRLTQPESNQILLVIEASGIPVTELSGTILRVRYKPQSENAEISVQNEAGQQITDVSYDGELLRFAADATGTYTIMEHSSTRKAQKEVLPLLPVTAGLICGLILTAGGITFFRRRRHG